MADYSGSGSTANTADIGGSISVTDNSAADVLSFINQTNSPGASATLTPPSVSTWLIWIGAAALAVAVYLYWRKK